MDVRKVSLQFQIDHLKECSKRLASEYCVDTIKADDILYNVYNNSENEHKTTLKTIRDTLNRNEQILKGDTKDAKELLDVFIRKLEHEAEHID